MEGEVGEIWEAGTAEYFYVGKHPPETGPFCINIVAGHTAPSHPLKKAFFTGLTCKKPHIMIKYS